jgi:hypothetical protein
VTTFIKKVEESVSWWQQQKQYIQYCSHNVQNEWAPVYTATNFRSNFKCSKNYAIPVISIQNYYKNHKTLIVKKKNNFDSRSFIKWSKKSHSMNNHSAVKLIKW